MIGIYKITNLINNKVYIGQSINIASRWRRHRTDANIKDTPLYQDIRKYGLNNFSFEVIEECTKEQLDERERFWIDKYDSYNNGYNLTSGGQKGTFTGKLNKKQIEEIYSLLQNTELTQQWIADIFDIKQQMIDYINRGISYVIDGYSYPIRQSTKNINKCINCGCPVNSGSKRCKKCQIIYQHEQAEIHYRNLNYPNRDELKNLIRILPFTAIASKYNVTDNAVRKWCDHYNLPRKKKDIKSYSDEKWREI